MEKPDTMQWEHPVLHWDTSRCHPCYNISSDGFVAKVDGSRIGYFSSAIVDKAFEPGKRYYFEVVLRSPLELVSSSLQVKVGITSESDMKVGYGFSDKASGWSYYLYEDGYKRHNSHIMDLRSRYGGGYRIGQILGVYIDLIAGYLAYSVDGEYYGNCYEAPELAIDSKLYAAVAMNNDECYCELVKKQPCCWEKRSPALFVKKNATKFCFLNSLKPALFREVFEFI